MAPPAASGLIETRRFLGQEGVADNAPVHGQPGVLGVTGFLMQNVSANPLDYVEGGPLNKRREEISAWLDSTNPDLAAFYKRGGKVIVTIGTDDTLASPGAQLDYYQSVLDKMGRATVDAFARLFVLPQTGHGLSGRSAAMNGDGESVSQFSVPNQFNRNALLFAWGSATKRPARRSSPLPEAAACRCVPTPTTRATRVARPNPLTPTKAPRPDSAREHETEDPHHRGRAGRSDGGLACSSSRV